MMKLNDDLKQYFKKGGNRKYHCQSLQGIDCKIIGLRCSRDKQDAYYEWGGCKGD